MVERASKLTGGVARPAQPARPLGHILALFRDVERERTVRVWLFLLAQAAADGRGGAAGDPGLVAADDQRPGDVAVAEFAIEGPAADELALVLPEGRVEEVARPEERHWAAAAGGEEMRGGRQGRVILDPPIRAGAITNERGGMASSTNFEGTAEL